jgi:hypothetical protein
LRLGIGDLSPLKSFGQEIRRGGQNGVEIAVFTPVQRFIPDHRAIAPIQGRRVFARGGVAVAGNRLERRR